MKSFNIIQIEGIKHSQIQDCILQCVEDMDGHPNHAFRDLNQQQWLSCVGYDKVKNPEEEDHYRLARFNLKTAAQALNAIKWEEEGVHDFIGQHFKGWTEDPDYQIYPDEYEKGPGGSKLNRKLTFTEELLELCRKADNRYCEDKLKFFNGEYSHAQLQLVPLNSVHEPFKDVINNETGKRDFHRGFQTRVDDDYHKDTVNDIQEDIEDDKWDPHAQQVALFELPKKYQYKEKKTKTLVKYGVANGNHRVTAALLAGETHIIAWIIKIPVSSLREWATAAGNAPGKTSNPRKKADVVQAIVEAIELNETEFAQELNEANENDKSQVVPLLKEYLKKVYSVRSRQIPSYIKSILNSSGVQSEYRDWTVKEFAREIIENPDKYPGYEQVTGKDNQFLCNGVLNIIVKDDTTQYQNLVYEIADEVNNENRPVDVIVLPPKGSKFDKNTRDSVRKVPGEKVMANVMKVFTAAERLVGSTADGHLPKYKGAPQFDDETTFVRVI